MPVRITNTSQSGAQYASPFINYHGDPIQVGVVVTGLTAYEITDDGYLKPGVVLGKAAGADSTPIALGGAAGLAVVGVTVELAKVAASNSAADIAAAGTSQVAIATRGILNRAFAEEMLGRAYTADEMAALRSVAANIVVHE